MRPLQIWLPRLGKSLFFEEVGRDILRAFQLWDSQRTVWFLPGLDEPTTLKAPDESAAFLYIPAEHFDRVAVYHANRDGYVYGEGSAHRFPESRLKGLLQGWLNCPQPTEWPAEPSVELDVPVISPQGVRLERRRIELTHDPWVPHRLNPDTNAMEPIKFPSRGPHRISISSEAETRSRFGPWRWTNQPHLAVSKTDPTIFGFPRRLIWPAPFSNLFPAFSGPDDLLALGRMKLCAKLREHNPIFALQRAQVWSAPYISQGIAPYELAETWPNFIQGGVSKLEHEKTVLASKGHRKGRTATGSGTATEPPNSEEVSSGDSWLKMGPDFMRGAANAAYLGPAERFGISSPSEKSDWRHTGMSLMEATRDSMVSVTRAWGAVGLFWALLIDELENSRRLRTCRYCGRFLKGKGNKEYCGPNDDPECHKTSRRNARRRQRNTQSGAPGS
jgi:hypothetical protein